MAKRSASKSSSRSKSPGRKAGGGGTRSRGGSGGGGGGGAARSAKGKHLVIVESPAKAKTINKYLGPDYVVMASVGHVRDLPTKAPKGQKAPVPGVDLEHNFKPTYEVLQGKKDRINELKRAAKEAADVWFATDLDREGEAIAWHLAEELGVSPRTAKRVIFAAITRQDIDKAFQNPHSIDMDRVNAQQARRILDRIVGYQVSPLLWKKVARGLSAGRVQSVAVRLVVEREREIRAFTPDEYWQVVANFALDEATARKLGPAWSAFLEQRDEKGAGPTLKAQNAWLGEAGAIRAELVEVGGEKFDIRQGGAPVIAPVDLDAPEETTPEARRTPSARFAAPEKCDLTGQVQTVAELAGLTNIRSEVEKDEDGKGPARWVRRITGETDAATPYRVKSIETKRTQSRPRPPFITSTLQQEASTRLGFGAQRTMRAAQQLYEGVDIPGEGPVGLITYMRTDSTVLSGQAIQMVREYIVKQFGDKYLPEKPNFYSSSNKAAQEAHEAIRPTSLAYPPSRVKNALKPDQFRLYSLIWERFVACQMTPAQWDSTTVLIEGGRDANRPCTFKATGRTLVFDGFFKVAGVPLAADTATLPKLDERQRVNPFWISPIQKFTSPPARYSEASLIKELESEGIGRPSTYASIIQTIQDRKYVEQVNRSLYATDLGEVVTDKLVEAFPHIMEVGYTRDMEAELDKVEDDHLDWVQMLHRFYGPFREALEHAEENLKHAKAETHPAPKEYRCQECGSDLVYRFGKNGRFLSCSNYPDCKYACPVDREGRPRTADWVNVACVKCGGPMVRRTGRFGPFLGCARYNDEHNPCDGILNIDKKGFVTAPSQPPLVTELPCAKCGKPLNLRAGIRGPWLGCSGFPKCRGRGKWAELPEPQRAALEKALGEHEQANPIATVRTLDGRPLTDKHGKPLKDAPPVEALVIDDPSDVTPSQPLGSVA